MIDFRYHLVSLISVFLALAVGIILGAGPLQGTIGDQLTTQVDALRADANDLRDKLAASEADAGKRLEFIQAAGPALVEGSLDGVRVAVVDVDDVTPDVHDSMVEAIESAGGTVAARGALTTAWTDTDHEGLRDTLASGMRPLLETLVPDLSSDASTEELLAAALGVALGEKDLMGARTDDAKALEQQLVQADLITVEGDVTEPADAVLLLSSAAAPKAEDGSSPEPTEDVLASQVTLARVVQSITPVVVAGPTASAGDLVTTVRGDDDASQQVSTVSGSETPVGRIVVPLALAAHHSGEVGQYGFEDGATPLPPVVRPAGGSDGATPEAPGDGTATSGDGTDGAATDGAATDGEAGAGGNG
ncbi:copper transporter [Xylanimonas protaetiae]|uniref:Copper transporter n=1 Tax=Xylanimonas protaetiae TaxID=2509457 RepID=A0A4P6F8N7_9MICO|nr:copper transporter [Xylanimonas protaetiae]QAY70689.1 copper transporter [Xylanimonas protaetiae]